MYGGDPRAWFDMPPAEFNAYARMAPRLEAKRKLELYDVLRIALVAAFSKQTPRAVTRALERWERAAGGFKPRPRRVPTREELAALGIQINPDRKDEPE